MSVQDTIIFREMAQRLAVTAALVEQLLEEVATQEQRIEALEAGTAAECSACAGRRQTDALRQQRRRGRSREAEQTEPAMAEPAAA